MAIKDPAEGTTRACLARELKIRERSVAAVLELLGEGNTVPFIARYRKELTGGLDEVQIRAIEERHGYLTDLAARRAAITRAIEAQGKLDDTLRARIEAAATRSELEDLYLPYRKKRQTRATVARGRGLLPLAELILRQPGFGLPTVEARRFVAPAGEVPDEAAALAGARDIVAEIVSEEAIARAQVRRLYATSGTLAVRKTKEWRDAETGYDSYEMFRGRLAGMPSHRFLAVRRGEREGVLKTAVEVDDERLVQGLLRHFGHRPRSPYAPELETAVRDGYKRLLAPRIVTEVLGECKDRADRAAIEVFATNVREILLAPPLGEKPVIGIDPGLRTGCKCAAVDATGRFVGHVTIYPHGGGGGAAKARADLLRLVRAQNPAAIAIGNGTAGRETESFVREALAHEDGIFVLMVSEDGASVYSASDVAREEFPDLDLTVRGAISIARRLQDPLAELVKVEPRALGVGQYQHDVDQRLLAKKLDEVTESAVNLVGVELNTASAPLLARVAGIGPGVAASIVAHRNQNGAFPGRRELLAVAGLGPKTFEQAAGFLRVQNGAHPLDNTAVHPERYETVERIARDLDVSLPALLGSPALVERIDIARYLPPDGRAESMDGPAAGEYTLRDIVAELEKPGRDPRRSFEPPRFRDDVRSIDDLEEGMELAGVVTNVTAFGAFVDIGVHRDGLVHISELADHFVRDPSDVVRPGQSLSVRVLEVDRGRRRISLSAREG